MKSMRVEDPANSGSELDYEYDPSAWGGDSTLPIASTVGPDEDQTQAGHVNPPRSDPPIAQYPVVAGSTSNQSNEHGLWSDSVPALPVEAFHRGFRDDAVPQPQSWLHIQQQQPGQYPGLGYPIGPQAPITQNSVIPAQYHRLAEQQHADAALFLPSFGANETLPRADADIGSAQSADRPDYGVYCDVQNYLEGEDSIFNDTYNFLLDDYTDSVTTCFGTTAHRSLGYEEVTYQNLPGDYSSNVPADHVAVTTNVPYDATTNFEIPTGATAVDVPMTRQKVKTRSRRYLKSRDANPKKRQIDDELEFEERHSGRASAPSYHPIHTAYHRPITAVDYVPDHPDDETWPGRSAFRDQTRFLSSRDLLADTTNLGGLSTAFENREEAAAYVNSLFSAEDTVDDTLPTTDNQRRALVAVLFQAFKSTALAQDNHGAITPFNEEIHDNRLVEYRLWLLLDEIERASQVRESVQVRFGGPSQAKGHVYRTFAERYDAVRWVLAHRKGSCKNLMETAEATKLADDPLGNFEKAMGNKVLNRSKKKLISLGRQRESVSDAVRTPGIAHSTATTIAASSPGGDDYSVPKGKKRKLADTEAGQEGSENELSDPTETQQPRKKRRMTRRQK